jgi:lambda family phage portal protein
MAKKKKNRKKQKSDVQNRQELPAEMQATLDAAMEAYRLGRRNRPNEAFQPQPVSGDAAILGSSDLMNRRTRDLVRNTAQGKKIVRAFTNLVVGKGMQTFAWPFLPSELFELTTEIETIQGGTLGPRLQYALESDDLFEEYFSEKKSFDAERRLSGPEMYRMLMGETVTVGNGLMVRVFRRNFNSDRDLVPVCWQMFEREQLDCSKDRQPSRQTNKIVSGIEFDADNVAVAYHLLLDHPHDYFGIGTSTDGRSVRVTADRVIDLALFDRPSSSTGRSWMDASGQSTFDRDSYMDSEIRAAAAGAVLAFYAKLKDAEKYGDWGFASGDDSTDDYGNREFHLGHSPVASIIGTDEELGVVTANRPNPDAHQFMKLLDRDIASSAGLSYFTLTGDYESANFTSTRGAKLDEDLDIAPLQQWFGSTVALPVRRTFNRAAVAGGLIRSIRPSEFRRNQRTYQRFDVVGSGRDLLDPFKEGEARTARLRTGMATFKEECARNGKHWIRVLMQQAIEKHVFKMFDAEPDWTKSGSGPQQQQQNGAPTAEDVASYLYLMGDGER